MCVGTPKAPDVPSIPERQALKLPDNGSTANTMSDRIKRRRGMYASILTGQMGAPNTSAGSATLG